MKGLAESSPFHLLTDPHMINLFMFGHGVVIYNFSFHFSHLSMFQKSKNKKKK